jgi:hypothetical protein
VIPHLKGWTRTYSGDAITLYPPEGAALGGIRYRERVRPLARVSHVVEQMLSRYPAFKPTQVGKPEMVVTQEGEYGALVKVAGTFNGQPAQRDLGFVFGDDFYALLSAISLVPDRFETYTKHVKLLVTVDSHCLGVRRRRFLYTPPAGWSGRPRGGMAEFTPPDFPRNLSLIQVFPANPITETAESVMENMLAEDYAGGFVLDAMRGPENIGSLHGLNGMAWNVVGKFGDKPRSHRDLVVFRDQRYLYSMRLETMQEERSAERQVFLDMVRSAHPIPTGSVVEPKEVEVLVDHWAL